MTESAQLVDQYAPPRSSAARRVGSRGVAGRPFSPTVAPPSSEPTTIAATATERTIATDTTGESVRETGCGGGAVRCERRSAVGTLDQVTSTTFPREKLKSYRVIRFDQSRHHKIQIKIREIK